MKNEKKVDLFIFGAPECGTSAIVAYLGQHSKVFFQNIKGPHYFCSDFDAFRRIRSSSEYEALFPFSNSQYEVCGEAAVWYLYSQSAAEQVYKYNPDAKIIIMLWRPVEMLPSLHTQPIFSGRGSIQDFREAWQKVALRKSAQETSDNVIEPSHLYYDEGCKYGEQVSGVLSVVPKVSVKVIFFDDFKRDPKQAVSEVLSFIGLGTDFGFTVNVVNKAIRHRFSRISAFLRSPPFLLDFFKRIIKSIPFVRRTASLRGIYSLTSVDAKKQHVDASTVHDILQVYADDVALPSSLVGRPLDSWLAIGVD